MKRKISAGLIAFAVALGSSVSVEARSSDDIQFRDLECREFVYELEDADEEAIGYIFMWLDGYLSGVSGDTMLRADGLEYLAERLVEYCDRNPRSNVLRAARRLGIR